jgi:Lipocalin-like domain
MKIRSLVALAGLTISSALPTFAQQASDLVGAWTLVSITLENDGTKTDFYGPNPQGQLMYDANGRFCVIITRSDLPKFASNKSRDRNCRRKQSHRAGEPCLFRHVYGERQIRLLPPTLRAVPSRIGTEPIEKLLSTSPGTNSASKLSQGR